MLLILKSMYKNFNGVWQHTKHIARKKNPDMKYCESRLDHRANKLLVSAYYISPINCRT